MEFSQFYFFRRILLAFAGVLIITSCSEEPLFEQPEEIKIETQTAVDTTLIDGHYIVVVSKEPAVKSSKAAEMLDQVTGEISKQPGAKISKKYTKALSGFAAELTEKQAGELQKDERIMLVEKDRKVYLNNEPVIQYYPFWGLDRIDQRSNELDRAYTYNTTGKGVTAYVIDTGIRTTHVEFEDSTTSGYNFVPGDGEEENCDSHGTSVASIIGGKNYGVAKDIELVSLKVFACNSFESSASIVLEALDWVNEFAQGPSIINASFGYSASDAMDIAFQNTIDSGIHITASAGNYAGDACNYSPGRVPGVITVGASDFENKIASFNSTDYPGSNFGSCVDIFAPGLDTKTASSYNDTNWRYFSGTSAAAPYVAGVIALYLENNPNATPLEVQNALKENATSDAISGVPSGTNDLVYSLWDPVDVVPNPPSLDLAATGEKIRGQNYANLTWNRTDAPFLKVYVNGTTNPVEHFNDGEQQIRLGDRDKNVTYMIQICEVLYGVCSEEIELVFGSGSDDGGGGVTNEPPKADFTYSTDLLSIQFTDTSTDPDGSVIAWNWNFDDGQTSSVQNPSHTFAAEGTYNVMLTVTDDAGDTGSTSKSITVSAEEPVPGDITLTGTGTKVKGRWTAALSWTPAGTSAKVDIYRNNTHIETIDNTGEFTDATNFNGSGSLTYMVCEAGSTTCSNELTLSF